MDRATPLANLERRSGFAALEHYRPLITRFAREGLLKLEGSRLRATEAGLWQLNGVVRAFLESAADAA